MKYSKNCKQIFSIRKFKRGGASVLLATLLFGMFIPETTHYSQAKEAVTFAQSGNLHGSDMSVRRDGNKLVWTVRFNPNKSPNASTGRYFFTLPTNVKNFRNWVFDIKFKPDAARGEQSQTIRRNTWHDYSKEFGEPSGASEGGFYTTTWSEATSGRRDFVTDAIRDINKQGTQAAVDEFRRQSDQQNDDKDFRVWRVRAGAQSSAYKSATITFETDLPEGSNKNFEAAMKKVSYMVGFDGDGNGGNSFIKAVTASNEELNTNLSTNDTTDNHNKNSEIPISDYNITWDQPSVLGRNDIGFRKSADGQSIYYLYDATDKTQFDLNSILLRLTANPTTENARRLRGIEKSLIESRQVNHNDYYMRADDVNKDWKIPTHINDSEGRYRPVKNPNSNRYETVRPNTPLRPSNQPYEPGTAYYATGTLLHYPDRAGRTVVGGYARVREEQIGQPGRDQDKRASDGAQVVVSQIQKIQFLDVIDHQRHGGERIQIASESGQRINNIDIPTEGRSPGFSVSRDGVITRHNGEDYTIQFINSPQTSYAYTSSRPASYDNSLNVRDSNRTSRIIYIPYVRHHRVKKFDQQPNNIYLFKGESGRMTSPVETVRVSGGTHPLQYAIEDNAERQVDTGLSFDTTNARLSGKLSDTIEPGYYSKYIGVRNAGENQSEEERSRGFDIFALTAQGNTINKRHGESAPSREDVLNAVRIQGNEAFEEDDHNQITREIVSINGDTNNKNRIPTDGENNVVKVKLTGTAGSHTIVDVIINYHEAPKIKVNNQVASDSSTASNIPTFDVYRGEETGITLTASDNSGKVLNFKATNLPEGVWFNRQSNNTDPAISTTGNNRNTENNPIRQSLQERVNTNHQLGARTITVTARDESGNETTAYFKVNVREQTHKYNPTGKTVEKNVKSEITDNEASSFVNLANAPQGTRYTWITKPSTDNTGSQRGRVRVTYPDGSTDEVDVTANVVDREAPKVFLKVRNNGANPNNNDANFERIDRLGRT